MLHMNECALIRVCAVMLNLTVRNMAHCAAAWHYGNVENAP